MFRFLPGRIRLGSSAWPAVGVVRAHVRGVPCFGRRDVRGGAADVGRLDLGAAFLAADPAGGRGSEGAESAPLPPVPFLCRHLSARRFGSWWRLEAGAIEVWPL